MLFRTGIAACLRHIVVSLPIFCFSVLSLSAQMSQTQSSISGTVADTTGAVISGARVRVSTPDNSIARVAISGSDGTFSLGNLPSGSYGVEISAPGFMPYQNESVAVAVGRQTRINVQLALQHAAQSVNIHAETSALDTSQSSPVTNIDRDRIEELPIPSRNYLNFALLSPQLASSNPVLAQHTPGAGEGGFSAGGLRPSSNALYIDGVDDNDEFTGLSRTELSPEAISDFQVVNHGYAAQSGGSAGGAVDVETRSGSNLQHGDAFLFVENGALNAMPALEVAPRRPDENRLRAGLSTGGGVARGKLFYYLAGEQEMARGEEAGDFGPQQIAQIDNALAQDGPLRGFRLQQGFFPTTNQETELSGRTDRTAGRNTLMLRYALTNNRSVNDAFNLDDLTDLSARGSAFYNDNSLNGSWSDAVTGNLLSQLNVELAQRRVALRTASTTGPGVVVAGIAQFGTPYAGNSRRYETHVDAGENLIWQHGRHLIQTGAGISHVALRAAVQDGFAGLYVFPTLSALAAGQPDFYTQSFGDPDTHFSEIRTSAYVQDHWTGLHGLSLDYGLRYESNRLPELFHQAAIHLSPRVGFAWTPHKNWVMRGGFGTFFDRYLLSTINRVEEFNGIQAQQQFAEGADAASLYHAGVALSTPHPGIAPSIWQAQPRMHNPYAESASLGIERALPSQWTVAAEYRFVHGVGLGRTLQSNLAPPVILTSANAASLGIASPTPQQMGRPVFSPDRLNPAYDAIQQFQTEASSSYNGLTFTVNRQFTEQFELMAGYTFSKTMDDASYDGEQPENPYALGSERARSLGDQRHRFVLSGLWVVGPDLDDPAGRAKASAPNAFEKLVYGLEFAPILEAGSGFADNPLTGVDSNREHIYPFAVRPQGQARNSLQTPGAIDFDLRVLKMVPIWRGHLDIVAESFNLMNRQNVDWINPVYGSEQAAAAGFNAPSQMADPRQIQFSLDFEY